MAERVLVADDEPDMSSLLELALRAEGYEVRCADDGERALEVAREWRPDLVVLDVMMPKLDGVEVCKRLRADHRTVGIPVILLTARTLPGDRVSGLDAGADDYVTKPFDTTELTARVRTSLRRARNMRSTSPLTGLPGNFEIERLLDRLVADGVPFALLHVDLDNFKPYNDRYGFIRGDHAIKALGEVLDEVAVGVPGEPLFLGHIGGDDFALIVPPAAAEDAASAVVAGFDERVPSMYEPADLESGCIEVLDRGGHLHRHPLLTVSVGIATTAHRTFSSSTEVAAVATEMKQLAKQDMRSAWRVDRRRA